MLMRLSLSPKAQALILFVRVNKCVVWKIDGNFASLLTKNEVQKIRMSSIHCLMFCPQQPLNPVHFPSL